MRPALILSAMRLATPCDPVLAQTPSAPAKAPAASTTQSRMPLVDGEVHKLISTRGQIGRRPGDIPNLAMPAMVMGIDVADEKMLDGLKVGNKVRLQDEMSIGKATVTELEAVKKVSGEQRMRTRRADRICASYFPPSLELANGSRLVECI